MVWWINYGQLFLIVSTVGAGSGETAHLNTVFSLFRPRFWGVIPHANYRAFVVKWQLNPFLLPLVFCFVLQLLTFFFFDDSSSRLILRPPGIPFCFPKVVTRAPFLTCRFYFDPALLSSALI